MANGIEELFPELANEQSNPSTTGQSPQPETATAGEIAPLPNTDIAELKGQVGQLTQLVGQLATRPVYAPPQQQEQQGQVDLNKIFQDTQFYSPQDAQRFLNTTQVHDELNRFGNQIKKEVAAPLLNVISTQARQLNDYQSRQQEYVRQQEMSRVAQQNQEQFYSAHPELKRFDKFVAMEAAQLQQEYQTNPALQHLTPQQTHKLLADRARQTLTQYGVNLEQAETPQVAPASTPQLSQHTRRPGFMERGGSSRAPAVTQSKDPNKRELAGMAQHMGRQRTRNAA